MRVLLVEDDPTMSQSIDMMLSSANMVVDVTDLGEDGLEIGKLYDYDIIILDLMLPDIDGWKILSSLRESNNHTPVLFLTARGHVNDRVKGLELGADDYLVKPFAFAELLARVRTLIRRGTSVPNNILHIADLEIDIPSRIATRSGRTINLTTKEFTLLELMVRRQGEVLPRSLIASQVWDMNFDSDTNVIDVAIRRLRAKIDDDFSPKLIQTVRGMGYKMCSNES